MLLKIAAAVMLILPTVGCVDDAPVESVIQVSKEKSAHEFAVDKNGKVTFEADIVYFKFDDYTLTKEGEERLQALSAYLKTNPNKKLQISGHSDERGSIEYNLALGQMRAKSVNSYLVNLGLDQKRIHNISYGEESPAVEGHSEAQWQKNRRAEFVLSTFSE